MASAWRRWLGVVGVAAVVGCGTVASMGGGGGASTGGARDLNLARSKVAAGQVPAPEDFTPEGLYAEHDLPIASSACRDTFCAQLGVALAPDVALAEDGGLPTRGYLQVGLASTLDPATLQRAALNAAVVIDNSGSMAGGKLEAVKQAAEALVDKLGPEDLLTVVRFDSVSQVLQEPVAVTDPEALKRVIRGLQAGGSTCIECGLREGFGRLARNHDASRSSRLFLFTDAQPNVGATGEGEFMQLLSSNAEAGVGTTAFGVGLDFGQALTTQITSVRGANYAFLDTEEHMRAVFNQDFNALVTPVAYDLELELAPEPGTILQSVYGVPGGDSTALKTQVKTVFLSRTRSALVARLTAAEPGARLGGLTVRYTTPAGVARESQAEAVAPSEAAPSYSCGGTHLAVTLTRFVVGAREACRRYHQGQLTEARAEAERVAAFMEEEATATQDPGLRTEATFARALADVVAR